MPPKKAAPNKESKKTLEKKKDKIVEDKTFGLKNKKGAKTQKFIQQVQKQVKGNAKTDQPKVSKKEEKKKELDELNAIFRPVTTQKVERGVDPKSVLCAFFKQGQCTKGDKCKFSHDLKVEKKSEKKSVYVDLRDDGKENGMENWDEETLRDAVEKKHGAANKTKPPTDIICKFFIEALEQNKYGWFWDCPNGGNKCHYRHALPPGFVLKKDRKKAEKEPTIALEELVEVERSKLPHDLPKLTLESFLQWKKRKIEERRAKLAKEEADKKAEFKAGRNVGLSGRDMFTFNPELAQDSAYDDGEVAFEHYDREDDEDGDAMPLKEMKWDENDLASLAQDVGSGGGTQADKRTFQSEQPSERPASTNNGDTEQEPNGDASNDVDLSNLGGAEVNAMLENLDLNELVDSKD